MPKLGSIKTLNEYDFIDLGAGDGASLVNYEKKISKKGIGVEFDKAKVQKAMQLERNVVYGNALDLHTIKGKVDFVTCDNFLEHLKSYEEVEKMLGQAANKARKFIYIRHPSFEDIDYLASLGLKTYWSDWRGHTSMLTVAELVTILRKFGIQVFKVVPISLIKSSDDPRAIPLKAPVDQHDYEPKHGAKPKKPVKFDRNVYFAFDIIGMMPGSDDWLPTLTYQDSQKYDTRPLISFEKEAKKEAMVRLKSEPSEKEKRIRKKFPKHWLRTFR